MDTAAEHGESRALKDLAHKLKGSAGSLGLTVLMNTCRNIEIAKDTQEAFSEHRIELQKHVSESVDALENLMSQLVH